MIERIYLDSCAINRLSDDATQPRVREEAEAVERILDAVSLGHLYWIASTHLQFELQQGSDTIRRVDNLALLRRAQEIIPLTAQALERAKQSVSTGVRPADALHLGLALEADVQSFLTTDDRLIRQARRAGIKAMLMDNPVDWMRRRRPWLLPNP